MKTQPLFAIPDLPPENRKPEPIEPKQKIRPELPEKNQEQGKGEQPGKDLDKKKKKILPPDSQGKLGTKFDDRV
jgi:hypothetical protein